MRFNPKARLDTGRVSNSGGGLGGGRTSGIPIPGGLAGGGIGGVIVTIIVVVLFMVLGGGGGGGAGTGAGGSYDKGRMGDSKRYAQCKTGADANKSADCARVAVENSLYDFWKDTLPA